MKKLLLVWMVCVLASTLIAEPYFLLDSQAEWTEVLMPTSTGNYVRAATPMEWEEFQMQRATYLRNGTPPEYSLFLPPDLYVFPGDASNPDWPHEACLVMAWGSSKTLPVNFYSSAWVFQYGLDPDLRNCTIKLTVHPPKAIVMVSFGLKDAAGNQCSWTWNNPANIPTAPPSTTITINTANVPGLGLNSSVPAAAAFAFNPAFDMSKVASVFINETFHNVPGVFPPPVPGGGSQKFWWNAWDDMQVTPNNGGGGGQANTKSFVKYSQPPVTFQEDPGMIIGWDEPSVYIPAMPPMMADDWKCVDERPITDIHWWGSFLGWTQPTIPAALLPKAFHIGIWTDVPMGADPQNPKFSHPGVLIWENYCDSFAWNFAGYDKDPRPNGGMENEACFQFNQLLSQDEWFRQPPLEDPQVPHIYWLSIAAIYDPQYPPQHPWGWKTRQHFFNDDAMRILQVNNPVGTSPWPPGPLIVNKSTFAGGQPVEYPPGVSWDLAFELTTNQQEPCHTLKGDINHDCKVDLADFTIFAADWLKIE